MAGVKRRRGPPSCATSWGYKLVDAMNGLKANGWSTTGVIIARDIIGNNRGAKMFCAFRSLHDFVLHNRGTPPEKRHFYHVYRHERTNFYIDWETTVDVVPEDLTETVRRSVWDILMRYINEVLAYRGDKPPYSWDPPFIVDFTRPKKKKDGSDGFKLSFHIHVTGSRCFANKGVLKAFIEHMAAYVKVADPGSVLSGFVDHIDFAVFTKNRLFRHPESSKAGGVAINRVGPPMDMAQERLCSNDVSHCYLRDITYDDVEAYFAYKTGGVSPAQGDEKEPERRVRRATGPRIKRGKKPSGSWPPALKESPHWWKLRGFITDVLRVRYRDSILLCESNGCITGRAFEGTPRKCYNSRIPVFHDSQQAYFNGALLMRGPQWGKWVVLVACSNKACNLSASGERRQTRLGVIDFDTGECTMA